MHSLTQAGAEPAAGSESQPGEEPQQGAKDMKCHLQRFRYKNIHPALIYRAVLSLAKSGTEPLAEVKPQPGLEPPAGSRRHELEGSFTKGLVSKDASTSEK